MVLGFQTQHSYDYDFGTASLAHFTKYPNPWSGHVLSSDTVTYKVQGSELLVERLIHKRGKMPRVLRAVFGSITDAWILETTNVDSQARTLRSWTRNIDHRHILRVDDKSVYTDAGVNTLVQHSVTFRSQLTFGIKNKIEDWSRAAFAESLQGSRQGMTYVMSILKRHRLGKSLA